VHPDAESFGLEEGDELLVRMRRDVVVVLEGDARGPAEHGVGKTEEDLELRALAVDLEEVAAGDVEPLECGRQRRGPDGDRSGGALGAVARRAVLAREARDGVQGEHPVGRGDGLRKRAGIADAVDAHVLFQAREGLGEGLEGVDPALRTEAACMHREVAHPGADVHDGPVRLDPGAPFVVAVEQDSFRIQTSIRVETRKRAPPSSVTTSGSGTGRPRKRRRIPPTGRIPSMIVGMEDK
jgi:hypothetical protein